MVVNQEYVVHGTLFELPERYEVKKMADHDGGRAVGYATFGAECQCFDRELGCKVIAKKLEGPHTWNTVREFRLLCRLSHYTLVKILDCFSGSGDTTHELYFVTAQHDATLQTIIRSEQILTKQQIKILSFQLLEAVRYLHENNIIVTSLNPSNIFCTVSCALCIGDLGSAVMFRPNSPCEEIPSADCKNPEDLYTNWYKPPELLLSAPVITTACDVWSIGVILAELLYRRPLWPAANYLDQIKRITDALGVDNGEVKPSETEPDTCHLDFLGNSKDANTVKKYIVSLGPKLNVPLRTMLPSAGRFFCDLLENMIRFGPAGRMSTADLLDHPYFDTLSSREVTICKRADEDLGTIFDQKTQELTSVTASSPADLAGVAQYVGFQLHSLNGAALNAPMVMGALSPPVSLQTIGKGKTSVTLLFGKLLNSPLKGVPWVTEGMDREELDECLVEDMQYLRNAF